jgi:hypothetical protein
MILLAKRCERPVFPPSRGFTSAQKLGLRYERKVFKRLIKQFGQAIVEHNPWYSYEDDETGFHACSPDIVVWGNIPTIIEVKYTYTPEAVDKLQKIYGPAIFLATVGIPAVRTAVICKHCRSIPPTPPPYFIQWLGKGPIEMPGGR